uniref:Uncharacterized protein n=1 Tax=Arundo donax TaxID=35708 RepID=A0A0A9C4Q9_ARUDO
MSIADWTPMRLTASKRIVGRLMGSRIHCSYCTETASV